MSRSLGPPSRGSPAARRISASNLPRTAFGRAGDFIFSCRPVSGQTTSIGSPFSRGAPKCGAIGAKYMKKGLGERWYFRTIAEEIWPSTSAW